MELTVPESECTFVLDIDFSAIIDRSWTVHARALDFLVITAATYAADKIVPRKLAGDSWTRSLNLILPLQEPAVWVKAADALAESVSVLTGDLWNFRFAQAEHPFLKPRANRRKAPKGYPRSPVVSLLSGGLDSFIGALDLLGQYPDVRLSQFAHESSERQPCHPFTAPVTRVRSGDTWSSWRRPPKS
jgi:hypothetical protein